MLERNFGSLLFLNVENSNIARNVSYTGDTDTVFLATSIPLVVVFTNDFQRHPVSYMVYQLGQFYSELKKRYNKIFLRIKMKLK